ncbi:MAG: peptide ABC transporter substrate-binding protein [Caldilineaceae bacterium]|nr:peptide ABC transporter substrate-binding protein [Caldilineaceae bacterium]MBP8107609.1 peptide ABC transporter substrate-binding protein [Caldilineaceae bacterium]MBP8124093.1 peptide ABC transporter substrate-binding protein [Caldilineaceae bacterium]MBP9072490.1 peptide ABC transporter substrate-binding protein [Caldilineaceae bacterium]
MRSKKLYAILGVLLVLSMVLAACPAQTAEPQVIEVEVTRIVEGETQTVVVTATPEPSNEVAVVQEKVLRVNLGTYPDIIDPQKSSFVNEIAHLQMIYEGLTRLDPDLQTVPAAAESWVYSDDATQVVFTLRPDLKYSDGSVLNAERYAFSIIRNVNPETAGEYAGITDEIAGAPEWRGCDTADAAACEAAAAVVAESIKASHADGAVCEGYEDAACNTLTLTLSKPAPYFHTVMSLWVTYPAKEESISTGGEQWWNSSKFQIGNGPYVLQSLEPFVRGYFVPNANYWRGNATVDIEYSYITDSAVSFEAYKNDEFDIIAPGAEDLEVIKADAQLSAELNTYPGSCTFAVMFHQLKEPFTDQKVREAFAMGLDRESWVRDVLRGLGSPALTWIPPGYPGYDSAENRWGFDPDAAKAALAESSYGSVEALPPIKLTFSDTPRNRTRNEWLAAKWQEVLGVDIQLDPVESTTYTALTKDINTAPQVFILGWCADYPDPQNWLSVYWKTGGFGERIGYSNPDFDALVDQADTTVDPAERSALYTQAQQLLTDGAPVAFMWNNVNNYLVKPWITGVVKTPQDSGWTGIQEPLTIDIDTTMLP